AHEQVGYDAGEERSRAERDQVGVEYRLDRFVESARVGRRDTQLANRRVLRFDGHLAADKFPSYLRRQIYAVQRRREHAGRYAQHSPGLINRLKKGPAHLVERQYDQIAERMAANRPIAGKAMAEDPGDEAIFVSQRDQTIANVARRQNRELAAQTPRALAVVGYGDDRGQCNSRADPILSCERLSVRERVWDRLWS